MTGIELIAQERQRQIEENITSLFYDEEKVVMFASYLTCLPKFQEGLFFTQVIPEWIKDKIEVMPRIRQLSIAGALIAAEIDRLQAIEGKENE